jgi:hypothetical protein
VHEVIVLPAELADKSPMASMVREVNATTVSPEEQLSDHVYMYDLEQNDWFRVADDTEEQSA